MLQKSRELIYAVIAMVLITLGYLIVQGVNKAVPSASSLWGHTIGIIGFLMMLMTETLYSLRKRTRRSRWGKMSNWLEFHIFTGLVGPFMVLLHPGWQFKGLAGVLSLLTILIVISGFIGRYIYTAIPRTADGIEVSLGELERQSDDIERALARLVRINDKKNASEIAKSDTAIAGSGFSADSRQIKQAQIKLEREQNRLRRIIASRQSSRRLFSLWHTIHIPIGLTVFMIAFIHIGAAIYYSVLLK